MEQFDDVVKAGIPAHTTLKEKKMRFMMIMFPKDYGKAKAGAVPDFKDMEAMGKYNEELGKPACCSRSTG